MNLYHYLDLYRPGLVTLWCTTWYGVTGHDRWRLYNAQRQCYICGRKEDTMLGLVKLLPVCDMSLENKFVHVCYDHGRVADYDCTTGMRVELPLPTPYWIRPIRNVIHAVIIKAVAIARFIPAYIRLVWLWYVWVYFAWKGER